MSDSTPTPAGNEPGKSHPKLKAVMPHAKDQATQLTVEMGTHEHRALMEDVPSGGAEQHQPERRRGPGLTTVINTPQSGGLPGLWGVAYQATGITIIFGVFIWLMFTNRADRREEAAQTREERAVERSQNQAAVAAMAATLTGISSRGDIRDVKMDAAIDEIRRAVAKQEQVNQEILTVLKAILAKGNENEPRSQAPGPRLKAGQG